MIRHLVTTLGLGLSAPAPARHDVPNSSRRSVLATHADPEALIAVREALDPHGYQVQTASTAQSGRQALALLRPDVILVDPDLLADDGARIGRCLLGDEALMGVPVVALGEAPAQGPAGSGSHSLYDAFVARPVDAAALLHQMDALFSSARRGSRNGNPADHIIARRGFDPAAQPDLLLAAAEDCLPESSHALVVEQGLSQLATLARSTQQVHLAAGLQLALGLWAAASARGRWCYRSVIRLCRETAKGEVLSGPDMARLRVQYLSRRSTELAVLEMHLERRNFPAISEIGYNLGGTGAAYGFAELTEIGRALETAAKSGDAEAVDSLLLRIQVYLGVVQSIFAPRPDTPRPQPVMELAGRRRDLRPVR